MTLILFWFREVVVVGFLPGSRGGINISLGVQYQTQIPPI